MAGFLERAALELALKAEVKLGRRQRKPKIQNLALRPSWEQRSRQGKGVAGTAGLEPQDPSISLLCDEGLVAVLSGPQKISAEVGGGAQEFRLWNSLWTQSLGALQGTLYPRRGSEAWGVSLQSFTPDPGRVLSFLICIMGVCAALFHPLITLHC